jgi:hypothetical protein
MTREEIVESLMWTERVGWLSDIGISFTWATMVPSKTRPDLSSVVAIVGPSDRYSDTELACLLQFSIRCTKIYDSMFRYRLGANVCYVWKDNYNSWSKKMLSWETTERRDALEEILQIY